MSSKSSHIDDQDNNPNMASRKVLLELGLLRKDIREGICILNAKKSGKPISQEIIELWKEDFKGILINFCN